MVSNRYVTFKQFSDDNFEIVTKVNLIYNSEIDRSRKDSDSSLRAGRVARSRARKQLFDVLSCNKWDFFITFTVAGELRFDDDLVRHEFEKWRREVRVKNPSMYYVAVPEYHTKGCLHFHVVVGGVSADDLRLIDSGRVYHKGRAWYSKDFIDRGFVFDLEHGEGATIFNVGCWKSGFSTCTKVHSSTAVICYVSKYISKSAIDPRFYNKKRFYCSTNVTRPLVLKFVSKDKMNDISCGLSTYKKVFSLDRLDYVKYKPCTSPNDVINTLCSHLELR